MPGKIQNLTRADFNNCDILIIGAGASGLMAAHILAKAGKKVTILEARDRCGGRIHTISNNIELGAEFIHGNLPVTLGLLKESGIVYHRSGGEMWHYRDGKFDDEGGLMDGWGLLAGKLQKLKKDISINAFLEREFPGDKYNELKTSVRRFASGYDSADPDRASTFALRNEWLSEDEEVSYRINGGYGKLIEYLEDGLKKAGGHIVFNKVVKEVRWRRGGVEAICDDKTCYAAGKVIIALPLSILQVDNNEKTAITFEPPIPRQIATLCDIGFGAVIKIMLEFDAPFWTDERTAAIAGKSLKGLGFLLSDEQIPTWWTQAPKQSNVLTGWLSGPVAAAKKHLSDTEILEQSLISLGNIFSLSPNELRDRLNASHIINWTADPFTLGSYAYDTVESSSARKILQESIDDTIFFAGEYLYDGPAMGTVEAALVSGERVADQIIISF